MFLANGYQFAVELSPISVKNMMRYTPTIGRARTAPIPTRIRSSTSGNGCGAE